MNLVYFKSQICEELQGARDYAKLAIATRVTDPTWSNHFASMSSAELDHANKLFKMAEEYYTGLTKDEQNGMAGRQYRCIVNLITEDGAKVRYMHELLHQSAMVTNSQAVVPAAKQNT